MISTRRIGGPRETTPGGSDRLVYHRRALTGPGRVPANRYRIESHPKTNRVKTLELIVTTADGVKRKISCRPLGNTYHLLAAGYLGGYKGWLLGKWRGPYDIDGEKLDITDKKVLKDLSGGVEDVLCEFKWGKDVGYGIL